MAALIAPSPRSFSADEVAAAEALVDVAVAGLARLEADDRRSARDRARPSRSSTAAPRR